MIDLLMLLADFKAAGFEIRNDGAKKKTIADLQNIVRKATDRAAEIQDNADAAEREVTTEEADEITRLLNEASAAMDSIERRQSIENAMNRISEPQPTAAAPTGTGVDVGEARHVDLPGQHAGNCGFRNFGEFGTEVFRAARAINNGVGHMVDPRLTNVTTGSSGNSDADGGFALPPDFREEIQRIITGENTLYGSTDNYDTERNEITFPKDETTPWNTTGIQMQWKTELAQAAQRKVVLKDHKIPLHNAIVLAPVSDELLDDAPAVGSYLQRKAPEVIDFGLTDALMNGDGSGKPEGVLQAAAGIEIAKETGQAADTIVFDNVVKMFSRLPQRFWRGARWQAPQTALAQLLKLKFDDDSPVFLQNNNVAGAPFQTLMGLPLTFTEAAPALGDAGDLSLVGWQQYSTGQKVGGIRAAMSIHLFFDWMATAFRFNIRMGGVNWLDAAYLSNDGATTYSNIIKLAARA